MRWDFAKLLDKYYEKELDRIKAVQNSIKHPRFYYAEYNIDTGEIKYRKKKWYQWFSAKRIVHIKIKPLTPKGIEKYATIPSDDGK